MNPLDRLRLEKAAADCGFELTPFLTGDDALELRSSAFPETLLVSVNSENPRRFRLRASANALLDNQSGEVLEALGYGELYAAVQRASAVARTMPNRVADRFRQEKVKLPQSTEAERLVVQRVAQGLFRDALLDYWQGRCCVTGLDVPGLLRASHIKPWAKCDSDDERLDVFNGLLLAPNLDALFDGGWVSFSDDGRLLVSDSLPLYARGQLGVSMDLKIHGLKPAHMPYLEFLRIPAKLDTDSTPSWTRIPEQAGQSERSDAGFWCFTLRMPSGSSFQSVSADADWLFQRLNRSAAQSYPWPAARLRSLYSRLAGGRRWVTRRTCGEGHGVASGHSGFPFLRSDSPSRLRLCA